MRADEPDDPLARFFVGHRQRVQEADADEVRWRAIVRRARVRRRATRMRYTAGAAAAVLLGVVAVSTWPEPPGEQGTSPVGRPSDSAATVPDGSEATVPESFVARSLSDAGRGNLFLLGVSDCGGGTCPTLLASEDDGSTWRTRGVFEPLDADAGDGQGLHPGASVQQVHFATPDVGWVHGSTLQVTRDGGSTWSSVPFTGEVVLGLASNGQDLVMTSADGCRDEGCRGPLHITRAPVAAEDVRTSTVTAVPYPPAPDAPSEAPIRDAQVHVTAQEAYVVPDWAEPAQQPFGPVRVGPEAVDQGSVEDMATPTECGQAAPVELGLAADGSGRLFAVCSRDTIHHVSASTNGGRVWDGLSSGELDPVAGDVTVAATDAQTVLVVSGGDDQRPALMQLSHDGGRSWTRPASPPPAPAEGWQWAGASPDGDFHALTGRDAVLWVSRDGGRSWEQLDPRG